MKQKLIQIIKNLEPKQLGVAKIKLASFRKLGVGEGNVNYVFHIKNKKFICRINIDAGVPNKAVIEYNTLKNIEKLKIAPKVFYLHNKAKDFPLGLIILEFINGKPWRMKKRDYSKSEIKQLARLLAELHTSRIANHKPQDYSFDHYVNEGDKFIRAIDKCTFKKHATGLNPIRKSIIAFTPKVEKHEFALIHGDVCPQNIISAKTGLKLIDWESLRVSDPAQDISNILIDVGLKGKNLELFLKEYHKIRKDQAILKRAKVYAVLKIYNYFLWEIVRAFEIISKKLPKEYLKKSSAQQHINEAKHQLRKLSRSISIPKIDVDEFFKK